MHVLGNAEPTDNVAIRDQIIGGGEDIEIQRARQVNPPPTSPSPMPAADKIMLPLSYIFFQNADRCPISWAKVMVCIFMGHENAENTYN
jgi:hypothetical protein